MRRRLRSLSPRSILEPLFVPDLVGNDVVDLFPKLLNNALNFLFEAFIAKTFKARLFFQGVQGYRLFLDNSKASQKVVASRYPCSRINGSVGDVGGGGLEPRPVIFKLTATTSYYIHCWINLSLSPCHSERSGFNCIR